jgi:hypothetical protein
MKLPIRVLMASEFVFKGALPYEDFRDYVHSVVDAAGETVCYTKNGYTKNGYTKNGYFRMSREDADLIVAAVNGSVAPHWHGSNAAPSDVQVTMTTTGTAQGGDGQAPLSIDSGAALKVAERFGFPLNEATLNFAHAIVKRADDLRARAEFQKDTAKCRACNGNDCDMPCAYPEGHSGCLRDEKATPNDISAAIAVTEEDAMDTLVAVLNAIGYTEEFVASHPSLKVSEGVKLFLADKAAAVAVVEPIGYYTDWAGERRYSRAPVEIHELGLDLTFDADHRPEDYWHPLVSPPAPIASASEGVPFEPTEAMLNAARDWSVKKYGIGVGNDGATGCWQAMLTAAHPAAESLAAAVTRAALKDTP